MIIVSIGAGLGNQMFEYAFYVHLKKIYLNQEIKLDIKYAFPIAHNGIEIFDIFGLNAPEASFDEVMKLTKGYRLSGEGFNGMGVLNRLKKNLRIKPSTMVIQKDFTEYYPEFFLINNNESIYFFGPFANYHYFRDIEEEIKDIYFFPRIEDENNKKYKEQIKNCNSVSIHVRIGDYVKEGIQLTSKKFYNQAIREIEERESNVKFFVFTDDIVYAKKNFADKKKFVIIEGNMGKNCFRDMQLMSLCKHNITANSTFSFWGAFLNRNNRKIVISPNLPYTGGKCPFVCDDWILL